MVVASSLLYLLIITVCAARVSKYLAQPDHGGASRLHHVLVWSVVAWSLFLLPFHLLGFVDLALGYRLVGPGYTCLVVGALLVVFLLWERKGGMRFRSGAGPPVPTAPGKLTRTIGSLALFALAVGVLFLGLVRITGYPIRIEGLAYHLPIGVHAFQTGSLRIWDPAFMHAYPANQSLYLGFLLGVLPEQLVSAANMPFLALTALALVGLCRTVAQDSDAASLAAVGIVTIPTVVSASETIESDIGGLALLAVAAYFTLGSPARNRRTGGDRYLLAGIAAGLAFGFKSLHLVGAVVLGFIVAAEQCQGNGNGGRCFRGAVRSFSLFAAAGLAASSFWLIRNYVEFGSPLYPVFVPHIFPLFGWTEPPDAFIVGNLGTQRLWVDSGWEWMLYPWRERGSLNLGPFFALVAPLSLVYSAWRLSSKGCANRFRPIAVLSGCVAISAIWWLLGDRQPRYVMGALVFLAPLVAWTLSRLDIGVRRYFNYIVVFAMLLTFSLSLFSSGLDLVRRTVLTDQSERHIFYQYPPEIDGLPAGSVIVNLGFDHRDGGNHRTRAWNYPLFGKNLTNHVVSFSEAVRLFSESPYETQEAPAYRLTADGLRAINATHLFVIGRIDVELEDGLSVIEQGRLDENPVTNTPLAEPRLLYEIRYFN